MVVSKIFIYSFLHSPVTYQTMHVKSKLNLASPHP
jgi:hypothetical protein